MELSDGSSQRRTTDRPARHTRRRAHCEPGPDRGLSALSFLVGRAGRDQAAMREVAESLSHELRTPLTTIYSGSKILSRPRMAMSEATMREVSAAIEADAERLYRIVEDLVVAALPEGRAIAVEPVSLQHLLPGIVRHEQTRWPATRFATSIPVNLPPVGGDEFYLEQVVRNLLANAARFGPEDGLVVTSVTEGRDDLVVRVTDEGPGIDPGEEDRVFGLFYRSPATVEQAGLGLGLFVCRRLVEAMDGAIWATNRRAGGAEVGFRIPLYPADPS